MVAHSGAGRDREPRLTRLNVLLKADSKQLCSEFYCLCGGVACSTFYSSQYVTLRVHTIVNTTRTGQYACMVPFRYLRSAIRTPTMDQSIHGLR
jgi:hypothetical protein